MKTLPHLSRQQLTKAQAETDITLARLRWIVPPLDAVPLRLPVHD
jgi:hypothetical protein